MTDRTEPTREEPFALTLHRRTLIRGGLLGGLGLAAAALIGCGDDDDDDDDAGSTTTTTSTEAASDADDDTEDDTAKPAGRHFRICNHR